MARWVITQTLAADQPPITIRDLLQQQWLIPKRIIHYLRVRDNVLVNGHYHPFNTFVKPNDRVELRFIGDEFRTGRSNYRPTAHPRLDILYEDSNLLVVNKPAGQKMHPNEAGETGTVMNDVAGYLAGSPSAAYMVHRLDKETSGAVIVAKNPVVVPILDKRIAAGQVHRQYLAVVEGQLTGSGHYDAPIGDDPTDPWRRKVNGPGAQPAVTDYRSLAANAQASLVALTLQTGRTHQLRVHLSQAGHPIIGDPIYNPQPAARMLLHGYQQTVILPFSNRQVEIKGPTPPYFNQTLIEYGLVR